jgi:hypothetical protein
MRRAGRTDANQQRIVALLRFVGASVAITSGAGDGLPDAFIGWYGDTLLFEFKDGDKPPSARQLTPDERYFVDHWTGRPVQVVESEEAALLALGFTEAQAREAIALFGAKGCKSEVTHERA